MTTLPTQLWPFLWHFIKKQKWRFAFNQLGSLAWALDNTAWPLIFMFFIDALTNHQGDRSTILSTLAPILFAGAFLWVFIDWSFRLAGIMWVKAGPKLEADVRLSLFDYVQRHSYNYFSNQLAGSLSNKINDMPQSLSRILQMIMSLFIPVGVAIAIATVLFIQVNPLFALILVTWIVLHLGFCLITSKRCDTLSHIHAESRSTLSGKIVDSLSNHINVKLFARYPEELKYTRKYQDIEQAKHEESLWYIEKVKMVLGFLSFLFPCVLMTSLIISEWMKGNITTGEVVFIWNSSSNITIMAWIAGLELPNLFREIGVAKQALTLIQVPHEIVDDSSAKDLHVKNGEIIFDKVTFHYVPEKALFKNKSLTIHPGEKVGLVGFSGSGKTSFINLILRHFEVEEGRILIDGQDIAQVSQKSLREAIAMIPQEPVLFHRTLMENIRYGKLDASDEEIFDACKKAHCHDFIAKLPDGYQTLVGERGLKLSGGQRQRIAIARAVLKNAPILILDEATSSLDSITEKHIQQDLYELMQGRTAIVIAHRLSTIASMDRILVFEAGEVLEEGTHDELIQHGGRYAEMWQMQAGGFLPESLADEMLDEL